MATERQPLIKFKNQHLFEKYLLRYDALPSYKKVLSTMIKFEKMYREIVKPPFYADISGRVEEINAWRRLKRAEIYLNKRDLINIFDSVHGKRLVVTSRGHKIFYKDYPLAKLRDEPWDGTWTLVMYDFPEKERETRRAIRRELVNLGFGSPQISILISPLPIEEPIQKLLEGREVADRVWTLRAKRILGMENRDVVKRAWPIIGELNKMYRELLEVLPKVKKGRRLLEHWCLYFLAINSADPYLPFELLPVNWVGAECEKEFVKLQPFGFVKSLLRKLS